MGTTTKQAKTVVVAAAKRSVQTAKTKKGKKKRATLAHRGWPTKLITTRQSLLRLAAIYGVLIVISATIALVAVHDRNNNTQADPFPAAQRQAVPITLYYPAHLPTGYQFDVASAQTIENTVVVLRATSPADGTEFSISQQAAPKDFNYNVLYNSFEGKTSFKVKLGTVTTGTIDNGGTRIVSLVTPNGTWILASAKADVTVSELRTVFNSLQPSGQQQ